MAFRAALLRRRRIGPVAAADPELVNAVLERLARHADARYLAARRAIIRRRVKTRGGETLRAERVALAAGGPRLFEEVKADGTREAFDERRRALDELGVDITHLVILVPTVLGGVDGGVVVQMTVICVGA